MSFKLRDYQREACSRIQEGLREHDSVMVEMPTGTGKTIAFVQIMQEWAHGRGLVICPMITLVSQTAKKLAQSTGEMPAIEQGSNWSNESPWARQPFIVASKQTMCKKRNGGTFRYERFKEVGLVIVDECHLSITEPYKKMLDYFRSQGAKVVGVTATAKRHDKRGMHNLYDKCVYQYGIRDAVADGWLVNSKTRCIQLESLDLSDVGDSYNQYGKDFNQKELNAALEKYETIYEIADVTAKETAGKKTVVFCSSVEEARLVSERLRDNYQINSEWICADKKKCSDEKRRDALKSFTSDDIDDVTHLCNVGILCLDDKTEILTDEGWTSIDDMTDSHAVAQWWQNGTIDFTRDTNIVRRQRLLQERMVIADGKRISLRMTEGHDIVYRTGNSWHKRPARDCVGKRFMFPVSGICEPSKEPIGSDQQVDTRRERRLAVQTAYNLRKHHSYEHAASHAEARRRVRRKREATTGKRIKDLTASECMFLGFWLGDGSRWYNKRNGWRVSASQSLVYPHIIAWFEGVLQDAAISYTTHQYPNHVTWNFRNGTGGGGQFREGGVARYIQCLNKCDVDWIWCLDEKQFDAYIYGFWMADGDHLQGHRNPKRVMRLYNTNRYTLETLQAVGTCRGYRTHLTSNCNGPNSTLPMNTLSMLKKAEYHIGNDRLEIDESPWKEERVWCASVPSGAIVTRRNGKVAVVGNCTGWDFPGLQCIVQARPTQSEALYTQIYGRGTRPLEGVVDFEGSTPESRIAAIAASEKPHFLMIDLVDNSLRHKIVTATDVLAGKYGFAVAQRAKDLAEKKDTACEPDELLLEAKQALEEEEEERRRVERARVAAEAKYRKLHVDPYNLSQRKDVRRRGRIAHMPFGKFKGTPVADLPTWYLKGCMNDKPKITAEWLQKAIQHELKQRTGGIASRAANPIEDVNRAFDEAMYGG